MSNNASLHKASRAKNDEFYTQLPDIERELSHYKEFLREKIVFCNCDDPYESNFFKYFAMNFNYLGLKKLICTCYDSSLIVGEQLSLFPDKHPYKIEITEVLDENGDGAVDLSDVEILLKNKNNTRAKLKSGDFRSDECIALLKQSDVVVTNPPFSLFREYVAQLVEYEKEFIIIGNQNAITYKEIFPLLRKEIIWLGYNSGAHSFQVPLNFEKNNTFIKNGKKYAKLGNICWFTNLDIQKRRENLLCYKQFNENDYLKYDNYNAINVDKVSDIPYDYDEIMGVPITFLDKHNPKQFEIIGLLNSSNEELAGIRCLRKYAEFKEIKQDLSFTGASGNKTNGNPVLRGKPKKGNYYINEKTGETVFSTYARILIKRRK